jgi:hypothetical protein
MRNQIALVVQQFYWMSLYGKKGQLPKFDPTSSLCFGDRYMVSYDSNATDWFDTKNAYIKGYDHNTHYGNLDKLIIELYESHGVNVDFMGDIPVSVLEEVAQ